jgi:pimeloyl-ACP methyl ester carboxylesterase
MPTVKLRTGIKMYYERHGGGEPLLLIMGTGGSHKFWSAQVPVYAREFTTIIYDARGVGLTDTTAPPYTMRMLADDAVALLDELRVERAHISGMSLGSTTAQEIAINCPERVASLQLHATWGRSDEWFKRMIDSMQFAVEGDLRNYARTAFMWVTSPKALEERKEYIAELERTLVELDPPKADGLRGQFEADRTHNTLDRLHWIKAPTLVTSGEMDWQVPTRYGIEVCERIPGAIMHVFRGPCSSHMALSEMAEVFNAVTLDFLRRHRE